MQTLQHSIPLESTNRASTISYALYWALRDIGYKTEMDRDLIFCSLGSRQINRKLWSSKTCTVIEEVQVEVGAYSREFNPYLREEWESGILPGGKLYLNKNSKTQQLKIMIQMKNKQ